MTDTRFQLPTCGQIQQSIRPVIILLFLAALATSSMAATLPGNLTDPSGARTIEGTPILGFRGGEGAGRHKLIRRLLPLCYRVLSLTRLAL